MPNERVLNPWKSDLRNLIRNLVYWTSLIGIFSSCLKGPNSRSQKSDLAVVKVNNLSEGHYDKVTLVLYRPDDPTTAFRAADFSPDVDYLEMVTPPGRYGISLVFFLNNAPVYTSSQCGNPPQFDLISGANSLQIYVCDADGQSIGKKIDLECKGDQVEPSDRQLRLLSHQQYQNSITMMTGLNLNLIGDFPKEVKSHGILNRSDLTVVTEAHSDAFYLAAEKVAFEILNRLDSFIDCSSALKQNFRSERHQQCVESFIKKFAQKAFRSPLEPEELSKLVGFYNTSVNENISELREDSSYKEGLTRIIIAILIHPRFLYRWEIGTLTAGRFELTSWEVAQYLSYSLWSSPPDAKLVELAERDELKKITTISAEVKRMLEDPKARSSSEPFLRQWLGVETVLSVNKDAKLSTFDSHLRKNLYQETIDFFNLITFSQQASFRELMAADFTTNTGNINSLYNGQSQSNVIRLPQKERVGLLGHASLLASYADADDSNPIKRGVFVLEHLLCRDIPAPPPALMVKPPPRDSNATTRERFKQHSNNPQCSICHKQIDGIGFGMEDMDEIGRFRSFAQKPIDSSGIIYNLDGKNQTFTGTAELGKLLSQSNEARRCFVTQYHRYVTGLLETQRQQCTINKMSKNLANEQSSIKSILEGMIQDPAFLIRK